MKIHTNELRRKLESAITVEQLIDQLKEMPKEARVVFASDYGDITHTRQLTLVDCIEEVDETYRIYETAYSNSGLAVDTPEEDEDYRSDAIESPVPVVMLS